MAFKTITISKWRRYSNGRLIRSSVLIFLFGHLAWFSLICLVSRKLTRLTTFFCALLLFDNPKHFFVGRCWNGCRRQCNSSRMHEFEYNLFLHLCEISVSLSLLYNSTCPSNLWRIALTSRCSE